MACAQHELEWVKATYAWKGHLDAAVAVEQSGNASLTAEGSSELENLVCARATCVALMEGPPAGFTFWLQDQESLPQKAFDQLQEQSDMLYTAVTATTVANLNAAAEVVRPVAKGGADGASWKQDLPEEATLQQLVAASAGLVKNRKLAEGFKKLRKA